MGKRYFSEKVVEWYEYNKRDLPWRSTSDPYKVWLSEIILQQTRINQGLPYYLRFTDAFPDVTSLASASEEKVLRLWQGLGYYTRARNLHKCAKVVANAHKGVFPNSFDELKNLPGIGDYTAAAIASISFNEPVAVVDGNVFRVLSRVFGIDIAINSPAGKKHFTMLANELMSHKHPANHNQAVMEFGALHCTPQNPKCPTCIFQDSCFAYKKNLQDALPVKLRSKPPRKRYFYYFVFKKGTSYLMRKRDQKDIWHGLYEFYLIEKARPSKIEKLIHDNDLLKKNRDENMIVSSGYKHILTHQIIHSTFVLLAVKNNFQMGDEAFNFYPVKKIAELPKSVLISRFLSDELIL
jgi:A/G-specific adenine glycosylase